MKYKQIEFLKLWNKNRRNNVDFVDKLILELEKSSLIERILWKTNK